MSYTQFNHYALEKNFRKAQYKGHLLLKSPKMVVNQGDY